MTTTVPRSYGQHRAGPGVPMLGVAALWAATRPGVPMPTGRRPRHAVSNDDQTEILPSAGELIAMLEDLAALDGVVVEGVRFERADCGRCSDEFFPRATAVRIYNDRPADVDGALDYAETCIFCALDTARQALADRASTDYDVRIEVNL